LWAKQWELDMLKKTIGVLFSIGVLAGAGMAEAAPIPGAPTVYQNSLFRTCDGATITYCQLAFPKVPVNKVLRLSNLHCNGFAPASIFVYLFTGAASPTVEPAPSQWIHRYAIVLPGAAPYNLNESLFTHIPANTNPRIAVANGANANVIVFCTLTGQLLPLQ
jgi:hypothetical protein